MKRTALERFIAKTRDGPDDCWEWTACLIRGGYSQFSENGKNVLGHRWAYEHWIGPIPEGLEIDHLCRNRWCVNPEHLEVVTRKENIDRSPIEISKTRRKLTHCPQGHPYSGENLIITIRRNNGRNRICRECHRIQSLEYVRRKNGNATV